MVYGTVQEPKGKKSMNTLSTETSTPIINSTRCAQARLETDPQLRAYWTNGYIALRGLFSPAETAAWGAECDRLLNADFLSKNNIRTPFKHNSGDRPERIDPVVDISPVFAALAKDPRIVDVVAAIFRDKPLLFKDKIIFKAPGTHGYTMHQDQAWWQLCPADDILSVSIQIDGANAANGCIEMFPGYHDRLLTPSGLRTNLRPEELALVATSKGEKIETRAGDVLIFHSLAPHQSATNTADVSRRSFYLTYSAARSGDHYAQQLENYKAYSTNETLTHFK
jgi:hypothetical protein